MSFSKVVFHRDEVTVFDSVRGNSGWEFCITGARGRRIDMVARKFAWFFGFDVGIWGFGMG